MIAKAWWFSIAIILLLIGGAYWWFQQRQVVEVLHINTPEAETTVPVYAQFDVTQTLKLNQTTDITNLVLPVRLPPEPTGELVISLHQSNTLIQRWRIPLTDYKNNANQLVNLSLDVVPPQPITGDFEINIAAPGLDAHFPALAPSILIETDDQGYTDGNYRIAQNEKKGDMSVTLKTIYPNWEMYQQQWHRQTFAKAMQLGQWLFLSFWLISLPWLWHRRPTNYQHSK